MAERVKAEFGSRVGGRGLKLRASFIVRSFKVNLRISVSLPVETVDFNGSFRDYVPLGNDSGSLDGRCELAECGLIEDCSRG